MQTIIILSVFVTLLAYLSKYKNTRFLFELAFFIIFCFTAFRFNFGRDYQSYHDSYIAINYFTSFGDIQFDYFNFEPAWAVLNFIFKPIGFFAFIIVLSAFFCYTYYSLIKKYVHPNYYWVAVFIYVFSSDIMWIQFSAIRQALSIAIFIHSVKFITEKNKPLTYVLLNLFGGLFHSSAFFMVPLVAFSFKKIKKSKITGFAIVIAFWSLLIFGEMFLPQIIEITSFLSGDRYTSRFDREIDISTTIIGSIAWGTLLAIVIYYARYQSENIRNLFYITALHSMVYVMNPLIWLAGRMGYYFAIYSLITYPLIMQYEKRKLVRIGVFSIYAIYLIYRLRIFLELEWVIEGYLEYKTIFPEIF